MTALLPSSNSYWTQPQTTWTLLLPPKKQFFYHILHQIASTDWSQKVRLLQQCKGLSRTLHSAGKCFDCPVVTTSEILKTPSQFRPGEMCSISKMFWLSSQKWLSGQKTPKIRISNKNKKHQKTERVGQLRPGEMCSISRLLPRPLSLST